MLKRNQQQQQQTFMPRAVTVETPIEVAFSTFYSIEE